MGKSKPKTNAFTNAPKKELMIGEEVTLLQEINGAPPGCIALIQSVEHDGAVFRVKVIRGLGNGVKARVTANQIEKV